jgi:hypothetical protein
MALTLASGISASDRYCTVNQPPTQPPGSYYRIGDEVVQHIGYVTTTPIWTPNFTQLYIARAQLGTTAASHLSGAALTYVRPEFLSATAETDPGPFEGGGGGGGITNTAPAGSVAVSDGTDITGSANLTWDDVGNTLGLAAAENGGGTIEAIGVGGQLFIRAHAGDASSFRLGRGRLVAVATYSSRPVVRSRAVRMARCKSSTGPGIQSR